MGIALEVITAAGDGDRTENGSGWIVIEIIHLCRAGGKEQIIARP